MPAKKATDETLSLANSKLKRLEIRNFRCIGTTPVSVDLDDIVVLVGPNNTGKSTILRVYEVVMGFGGKEGKLTVDDLPNNAITIDTCPEIVLETYLGDEKPGEQWILKEDGTNKEYIKERFRWEGTGDGKRQGFRRESNDWVDEVPWGAPNVAKSYRPQPRRVEPFQDPKEQADKLSELLIDVIKEGIGKYAYKDKTVQEALSEIEGQLRDLQKTAREAAEAEIQKITGELAKIVARIFPGHVFDFDAKTEDLGKDGVQLFKSSGNLLMGPEAGHKSTVAVQGSGARRTLLWAILKLRTELDAAKPAKARAKDEEPAEEAPKRGYVLLIDEPEICLDPSATREACKVLYDLAEKSDQWQVMVTTHSPVFVDVSRDNTTIVRVERTLAGGIQGTTVFRPEKVKLDNDERALLKLLNIWDPYFAEFFFGGRTIVVEGDTEYSALSWLAADGGAQYSDVHIVRARGKEIIAALMKILNQFGSSYSVLHDSDRPLTSSGRANSAWTANERIKAVFDAKPTTAKVRVIAALENFEAGILRDASNSDKPYHAVTVLKGNAQAKQRAKELLDALLDHGAALPEGTTEWEDLADLESKLPPQK